MELGTNTMVIISSVALDVERISTQTNNLYYCIIVLIAVLIFALIWRWN